MLNNFSRAGFIGAWLAAVTLTFAISVICGAAITISTSELWLMACLLPPAVMLAVWRGAPPATVAEVLYAVNRQSTEGRS